MDTELALDHNLSDSKTNSQSSSDDYGYNEKLAQSGVTASAEKDRLTAMNYSTDPDPELKSVNRFLERHILPLQHHITIFSSSGMIIQECRPH